MSRAECCIAFLISTFVYVFAIKPNFVATFINFSSFIKIISLSGTEAKRKTIFCFSSAARR